MFHHAIYLIRVLGYLNGKSQRFIERTEMSDKLDQKSFVQDFWFLDNWKLFLSIEFYTKISNVILIEIFFCPSGCYKLKHELANQHLVYF